MKHRVLVSLWWRINKGGSGQLFLNKIKVYVENVRRVRSVFVEHFI